MAKPYLDRDRAAMILVESSYFGDTKTAHKFDITTRTIRAYRLRLNEDDELSEIFQKKMAEFNQDWAAELPRAIIQGTQFLIKAFENLDETDPIAVKAVSEAMKTLAEIGMTKDMIDARFNRQYQQNREENKPVVSTNPNYVIESLDVFE